MASELTLINTRLPLRSQSVIDSLFESDILPIGYLGRDFLCILYINAGGKKMFDGRGKRIQCG